MSNTLSQKLTGILLVACVLLQGCDGLGLKANDTIALNASGKTTRQNSERGESLVPPEFFEASSESDVQLPPGAPRVLTANASEPSSSSYMRRQASSPPPRQQVTKPAVPSSRLLSRAVPSPAAREARKALPTQTFTSSEGHEVVLTQAAGQWQAKVKDHWGDPLEASLPVVCNGGEVDKILKLIKSKPPAAQARYVHVMAASNAPHGQVVYLGPQGLPAGGFGEIATAILFEATGAGVVESIVDPVGRARRLGGLLLPRRARRSEPRRRPIPWEAVRVVSIPESKDNTALQTKQKELEEDNKALKEANENLKTTTETLEEDTKNLKEANENLKTTAKTLEEDTNNLKKANEDLQEAQGVLAEQNEDLAKQNQALQDKQGELEEELRKMKAQMQAMFQMMQNQAATPEGKSGDQEANPEGKSGGQDATPEGESGDQEANPEGESGGQEANPEGGSDDLEIKKDGWVPIS